MSQRHAHLVGSLAGADAEEAMRLALDTVGLQLGSLSDGETGERFHWILRIAASPGRGGLGRSEGTEQQEG